MKRYSEIILANTDEPALVDTCLFEQINRFSWSLDPLSGYAVRTEDLDLPQYPKIGQRGKFSMYRFTAKLGGLVTWETGGKLKGRKDPFYDKYCFIDHLNADKLDNRLCNLCLSSPFGNSVKNKGAEDNVYEVRNTDCDGWYFFIRYNLGNGSDEWSENHYGPCNTEADARTALSVVLDAVQLHAA